MSFQIEHVCRLVPRLSPLCWAHRTCQIGHAVDTAVVTAGANSAVRFFNDLQKTRPRVVEWSAGSHHRLEFLFCRLVLCWSKSSSHSGPRWPVVSMMCAGYVCSENWVRRCWTVETVDRLLCITLPLVVRPVLLSISCRCWNLLEDRG